MLNWRWWLQNKPWTRTLNTRPVLNAAQACRWYTMEPVNRAQPERCKSCVSPLGAAAHVKLKECLGEQPKLTALHIWHSPEQIGHLLKDRLQRPPLPGILSPLSLSVTACLFVFLNTALLTFVHRTVRRSAFSVGSQGVYDVMETCGSQGGEGGREELSSSKLFCDEKK